MPSIAEKRRAFRALHERGCFVIPNPWDVGTARYLQHLGFSAIATTSSGAAWSLGLPDTAVGRDGMLAYITTIVGASDLPVNADFESGYAAWPREVGESARMCVDTGVAGLSIEDSTGDPNKPLFSLEEAVARIRAARGAIDARDPEVMLVGRAECFLVGRTDLDETIARLQAYASAGADCLYAPGIRMREQIAKIVEAVAPKPVNVLIGGALGRAAWGGFIRAARSIAEAGTFDALADAVSFAELNGFFRQNLERRRPLTVSRVSATAPLRRAGQADVAAVNALQHAAYARNRTILGLEPLPLTVDYATIVTDYDGWLLEQGDALEGVLILETRADDLLIWSVAVAPEAQGRGIGNRLLASAEARARELGRGKVRLYTGEKLTGNIAWYERHGFAVERIEDLGDRRLVHMMKRLGD